MKPTEMGGLVLYQWGPGTNKAWQQYTDGQIQHLKPSDQPITTSNSQEIENSANSHHNIMILCNGFYFT